MTDEITILSEFPSGEREAHLWEESQWWAVQAARAANRPLLIRGEPGVGKTQLAYAAAKRMNRPIVPFTVDSNTEARDLLWSYDAVQRLAEAQVAQTLYPDPNELRRRIAVREFVTPGPVWWGINFASAKQQLTGTHSDDQSPSCQVMPEEPPGWKVTDGVVILIDEIDKADSDVPNGLLEAFGKRQFRPQGMDKPVAAEADGSPPLIIITTNEERMLPDAFVRRCLVLPLKLPVCLNPDGSTPDAETEQKFIDYLVERGKAHFGELLPVTQIEIAARSLMEDRRRAMLDNQKPFPGQAEYLDFLRAISVLAKEFMAADPAATEVSVYQRISEHIQSFVFDKSAGIVQ